MSWPPSGRAKCQLYVYKLWSIKKIFFVGKHLIIPTMKSLNKLYWVRQPQNCLVPLGKLSIAQQTVSFHTKRRKSAWCLAVGLLITLNTTRYDETFTGVQRPTDLGWEYSSQVVCSYRKSHQLDSAGQSMKINTVIILRYCGIIWMLMDLRQSGQLSLRAPQQVLTGCLLYLITLSTSVQPH